MSARRIDTRDVTFKQLGVGHLITRRCDYGDHASGVADGWERWQRVLWICPPCAKARAQARAAAAGVAA